MKTANHCRWLLIGLATLSSLARASAGEATCFRLTSFNTWYSVAARGDWSNPTTWNTQADGTGATGVPNALDQVIIQADDTVETDDHALRVSAMTLAGVLDDDNAYTSHNFGKLDGAGTLIVSHILPARSALSTFLSTGTVAYGGDGDYPLPSSPTEYYNLVLRGSGVRTVNSDLTVAHDIRIEDRARLAVGNRDLMVRGDWYNHTGATGLSSTGTVTFDNPNRPQAIHGITVFHNLTISKVTQTLYIHDGITLTNDFLINGGTVDSGETTLTIGDDWTNHGTYVGTGTVIFNGTNVTHVIGGSAVTSFGSLEINGTNSTFGHSSQMTIASDLSIVSGTFTTAGELLRPLRVPGNLYIGSDGLLDATRLSTLTIAGDWTNDGAFVAGLSNVVFDGDEQTLRGETDFYSLEKTNGGRLTLTDKGAVNGALALTEGHIRAADEHELILGLTATITGGSADSYVEGVLTHTVSVSTLLNDVKLFPFGSLGQYRPATLTVDLLGAANTVYYRGELREGPPPERALPSTVHHVSQLRYYRINQSALLPAVFSVREATVNIAYNADDVVDTPLELRVVKSDGAGHWRDLGGAGSGLVGDITSGIFTSFSDFVLGSSTANNPLPVELLSWAAVPQGPTVRLRWRTASETDNSHFVVERAADGKHYVPVATVAGVGTNPEEHAYQAWDRQPLPGRAYYRLKQVDFDGTYTHSRPVAVDFLEASPQVRLSPNPTHKVATVTVQGLASGVNVQIQLVDAFGRTLQRRTRVATVTPLSVPLSGLAHYPPGVYTVVVQSGAFYWAGRLLIE